MTLWNSTFKNPGKPLRRNAAMHASKPMERGPMKHSGRRKHKIAGHHDQKLLDICRGQSCYLLVPGVCPRIPEDPTVVDCHGNWADTGKGMGLKAADRFSVPGCAACHHWLDFGTTATRDEKRAVFFDALARWEPVRDSKRPGSTAEVASGRVQKIHGDELMNREIVGEKVRKRQGWAA